MTARALIDGLRQRGYHIIRFEDGVQTIIPCIGGEDPGFSWLQGIGVEMRPYRYSTERPLVYEALLHRATVDECIPEQPGAGMLAIWEAAA